MGKIVVIEGTDFSGKTTQYDILLKRLYESEYSVGSDSFPNYDCESSFFVRSYLGGVYGEDANAINPKLASTFYALDRYHSYMTRDWGKIYREGGDIIFARYITSNIIHQTAKLHSWEEKKSFIDWLYSFECGLLGLPKDDCTVLLNMPPKAGRLLEQKRLKEQNGLSSSGGVKDIHENNKAYLENSYYNALDVADYLGWKVISCVDENENIRSIEDISDELFNIVTSVYDG